MGSRALIVDDSSAMRAFVKATLEGEGDLTVFESTSGFEALRILPREPFDVVIVDVNMPDINGLELVSFMRKTAQHQRTPVIVISTESSAREKERALALGANAFVSKPFGPDTLLEAVRSLRATQGS